MDYNESAEPEGRRLSVLAAYFALALLAATALGVFIAQSADGLSVDPDEVRAGDDRCLGFGRGVPEATRNFNDHKRSDCVSEPLFCIRLVAGTWVCSDSQSIETDTPGAEPAPSPAPEPVPSPAPETEAAPALAPAPPTTAKPIPVAGSAEVTDDRCFGYGRGVQEATRNFNDNRRSDCGTEPLYCIRLAPGSWACSDSESITWAPPGTPEDEAPAPTPTPTPDDPADPDDPAPSEPATVVHSLDELQSAMEGNDGHYKLAPGTYVATGYEMASWVVEERPAVLALTGNNNTIDLTDATIEVPTAMMRAEGHVDGENTTLFIHGDGNTVIGGTIVNTYNNPRYENFNLIDFTAYNEDHDNFARNGGMAVHVLGEGTTLKDNTIMVRGSFPFGYGEIFGKGAGSTFGLSKHAGILVNADDTVIDGLDLDVQAFGHGIFIQGADNTVIRNSHVEGLVRLGADMLAEGPGSLPDRADYKVTMDGLDEPIEADRMYSMAEDGIRAYSWGFTKDGSYVRTGHVAVYDTWVENMRGGVALALADSAHVERVEARGNQTGFALPSNGTAVDSKADAAYGPAVNTIYDHSRRSSYEIEILDVDYDTGSHALATVVGTDHQLILTSGVDNPSNDRTIVFGRLDDPASVSHSNDVYNDTTYAITFTAASDQNTGWTYGAVVDEGVGNNLELR